MTWIQRTIRFIIDTFNYLIHRHIFDKTILKSPRENHCQAKEQSMLNFSILMQKLH